jgi:hypothetical protein
MTVRPASFGGTRLALMWEVAFRATHLAAWLVLTAGCGGIAEGRSPDPAPGEETTAPAKDAGDTTGKTPVEGDTELGACERGPAESYSQPCPWVVDRRCYTTREMACNCACPRSRDSVCLSGFEAGDDGHVEVSCD